MTGVLSRPRCYPGSPEWACMEREGWGGPRRVVGRQRKKNPPVERRRREAWDSEEHAALSQVPAAEWA